MDRRQLRLVVYKVVERMTTGELSRVELHRDLVQAIKREAPGVNGRKVWSTLTYIIHLLKMDSCRKKLLWRNCFSLVGVHGKGSRRQLEYHPEVCDSCEDRIKCLEDEPVRNYIERW